MFLVFVHFKILSRRFCYVDILRVMWSVLKEYIIILLLLYIKIIRNIMSGAFSDDRVQ